MPFPQPLRTSPLSRRGFAATVGGLGLAALLPSAAATAKPRRRVDVWEVRARASFAALQKYFRADDGSGLYRERYPVEVGDPTYSYEWPYSQAHVAALDLAGMRGVDRRDRRVLADHGRAQQHYWSDAGSTGLPGFASAPMPPYGNGGDFFYDDNEWVGLKDTQQWRMFRDRSALREAEQLFDLVVSGWDTDPDHAAPGGVFWTQAPWSADRNTVSNMPGAELGLRLHQITGRRRYRDWSLRMYDWTNRHLQRPDGLYHDHLDLEGTVEKTIWSYNQGVPVGVNVALYEVTGRRRYLTEAVRIARAARAYYATDGRLDRQPAFFNSIYFKNLLRLGAATRQPSYRADMAAYADRMWSSRRDPVTGLFGGADGERAEMIQQAAMVQIYAVLAWAPRHHPKLY
ncbi:glycoside hydrolase family 76 protein [Microlunatus lacustris]